MHNATRTGMHFKHRIFRITFTVALIGVLSITGFAQHKHQSTNTSPKSVFATTEVLHNEDNHKGSFFVGGSLQYWNDQTNNIQTFAFLPEAGYLLSEKWGIGARLGYSNAQVEIAGIEGKAHTFVISPFARWYYFRPEPFNLYLDMGLGWNIIRTSALELSETQKGFEVGIRPGACIDLTKGLCLCLRLGFIGYRKNFFVGEEHGIGTNGFGVLFAPEEAMIGLELEF